MLGIGSRVTLVRPFKSFYAREVTSHPGILNAGHIAPQRVSATTTPNHDRPSLEPGRRRPLSPSGGSGYAVASPHEGGRGLWIHSNHFHIKPQIKTTVKFGPLKILIDASASLTICLSTLATCSNAGAGQRYTSSQFRGVWRNPQSNSTRWMARIHVQGKKVRSNLIKLQFSIYSPLPLLPFPLTRSVHWACTTQRRRLPRPTTTRPLSILAIRPNGTSTMMGR